MARSKLCSQGRHDFDDATGACRRKGCAATMTRTMFPMTVAEEEQAYGFSVDRAAHGFRPGDAQQGLFDATNPCGRKHRRTTMKKRKNSGPRPLCTGCRRFLSDAEQRHGNKVCRRCSTGHIPEGSRYATRARKRNPIVLAPGAISWQGMAGMAAALGNPPAKGRKRGHPAIHYCVSFMAPGGEPVSACGATEGFVIQDKRRVTCAPCKRQKPMKRGRNPADFACTVCSKKFGHGRALYDPISQTWYHKGCVNKSNLPAGRRLYPRTPTAEGLAKFAETDKKFCGNPRTRRNAPDSRLMCLTCGNVMPGWGGSMDVGERLLDACDRCGQTQELEVVSVHESHRSNPTPGGVRWTCRMFSSGGHAPDCVVQEMGGADTPPAGWEFFPQAHRDAREKYWKDAECPACQHYGETVRAKYGLPPKRIRGRRSNPHGHMSMQDMVEVVKHHLLSLIIDNGETLDDACEALWTNVRDDGPREYFSDHPQMATLTMNQVETLIDKARAKIV